MSDYYAILRIQSGRLKAAMRDAGINTCAELSRGCGASQSTAGRFLNFKESPRMRYGDGWKPAAKKICKFLGYEPEDLFPEHLDHEVTTNQIESFVEQSQLQGGTRQQIGPYEDAALSDAASALQSAIDGLRPAEARVIRGYYLEGTSQTEIAEEMGTTTQNVHRLAMTALKKLRHPSKSEMLGDALEVFEMAGQ